MLGNAPGNVMSAGGRGEVIKRNSDRSWNILRQYYSHNTIGETHILAKGV